jgi:hypothetical protein
MSANKPQLYHLEVHRYCKCCLNPLTFELPNGDRTYSGNYIHLLGGDYCLECAEICGVTITGPVVDTLIALPVVTTN